MLSLIAALVLSQAAQPVRPPKVYLPSQTRVLLLPLLNQSGDKYEEMKAKQVEEGEKTLNRLFADRGFVVVPREDTMKAIAASEVDMADEENYRKDPLYKIGRAGKANLVVFSIVTATWQKSTEDFLFTKLEGFATLKTWLLDVDETKPILSAAIFEGRSTANSPTGSFRQIRAVRIGLETQLQDFLKPYPVVMK